MSPCTITWIETVTPEGRMVTFHTEFSPERLAEIKAEEAARIARNKAAMDRAVAAVQASAARSVIRMTKRTAREFLQRPARLNALHWNLSQAEPVRGLAILDHLRFREPQVAQFPANLSLMKIDGARLAFRWARRFEGRATAAEAA